MELKVNLTEFFEDSIDWLSVINDGVSYDEMLLFLDRNEVGFDERYFMDKKFVVIHKNSYGKAIELVRINSFLRITRLDVKMDFSNKFEDIVVDNIDLFKPYSAVSKKGKLQTLYFNSRQSDMFCRLYDKQAESGLDFPLTRLEFEIKGDLSLEFSKRLTYLGLDDAVNFIYSKINEFCERKELSHLFYVATQVYLPFEVIENQTIKNKFRRFVRHNANSYKHYMKFFDLSLVEFNELMNGDNHDLENFLCKY